VEERRLSAALRVLMKMGALAPGALQRTDAARSNPLLIYSQMIDLPFTTIDHVQLAMPSGMEEQACAFYSGLLGMTEIDKPAELKKRGGCWFSSGAVQIHLGVEPDFRPARKAHPALRCHDYDDLVARLKNAGVEVKDDHTIPGVERCHIFDPFGNRIELIRA